MALEFSFNKTNLDLENSSPLGGPINGIPGIHPNTPLNTYTEGNAPVTKNSSPLENKLTTATPDDTSLIPPTNPNLDPTQYPATTLGSTNISGHFPTTGKPAELFNQQYTPENTYLDQINNQ
tara:strand:- start:749 stop:1114 length:366 start_codon:yes stop_codon:yes gene_type:complete